MRTKLIYAFVGKTILVPLTNSLYVPGKLSDPENVIVDIGTGYYVKKVRVLLLHNGEDDGNVFLEPISSSETLPGQGRFHPYKFRIFAGHDTKEAG